MDKKARNAGIVAESAKFASQIWKHTDIEWERERSIYISGTRSPASAEWIVRRTIELARKPVTRILAVILKELGER